MNNKVYVAGSRHELEGVRQVQQLMIDHGYEITFDWTGEEGELRETWEEVSYRAADLAGRELEAIELADTFVLVVTKGRGRGCYVELGMAIALEKQVFIIGPYDDSVFFYSENVYRIPHRTAFRDFMSGLTAGRKVV